MATIRREILGPNTLPDTTGDVFAEPYSIKATNARWENLVFIFNDTSTDLALFGVFEVPEDYVGSSQIIVRWTSTAILGDVRWQFNYRAVGGDDTESLDQATAQETVEINDTAPSAIHERMVATLTLTAGNFSAGDTVEFDLTREGSDTVNDDMAAAAIVFTVLFEYSDA